MKDNDYSSHYQEESVESELSYLFKYSLLFVLKTLISKPVRVDRLLPHRYNFRVR